MKIRNLMLTGFGVVLILWLGSTWINRINDSEAGGGDSAVTGVGIFSEDPDRLNLSFWDNPQDAKLFFTLYLKQEMVNEPKTMIPNTGAVEETAFWDDRQDAKLFYSQYLKQELGTETVPDPLESVDNLQDGRYFDKFYSAE